MKTNHISLTLIACWNWIVFLLISSLLFLSLIMTLIAYIPMMVIAGNRYIYPYHESNVCLMIINGRVDRDVAVEMYRRPSCVYLDSYKGEAVLAVAAEYKKINLVNLALSLGAKLDGQYLVFASEGISFKQGVSPMEVALRGKSDEVISALRHRRDSR